MGVLNKVYSHDASPRDVSFLKHIILRHTSVKDVSLLETTEGNKRKLHIKLTPNKFLLFFTSVKAQRRNADSLLRDIKDNIDLGVIPVISFKN